MRLGELLIGQGLVTPEVVAEALKRQRLEGGRLGNHLVAMGALTVDQLVVALRGQREVGATLDVPWSAGSEPTDAIIRIHIAPATAMRGPCWLAGMPAKRQSTPRPRWRAFARRSANNTRGPMKPCNSSPMRVTRSAPTSRSLRRRHPRPRARFWKAES
jgi:hypothetical protein